VLFLVPGFPLIAGLFDLLQYQTVAAVGRFTFGLMILLSVALGLSFVVEVAKIAPAAARTCMPGVYAFEAIVLFNRGQMVEALQASTSCWFVVGALAMGLATARFFRPK
jgi:uncharacterized membrane protein YjjB (DUF3815 family)